MKAELPYWAQMLQALAVPAIAFLGAVIGGMQWYTAHRKVILDLFDRRLETFSAVRSVVGKVVTSGEVPIDRLIEFDKAVDRARFLFGRDVNDYLASIRAAMVDLSLGTLTDGAKEPRKRAAAFSKVAAFYTEFPPILSPYVRMDQKVLRMPWQA